MTDIHPAWCDRNACHESIDGTLHGAELATVGSFSAEVVQASIVESELAVTWSPSITLVRDGDEVMIDLTAEQCRAAAAALLRAADWLEACGNGR